MNISAAMDKNDLIIVIIIIIGATAVQSPGLG